MKDMSTFFESLRDQNKKTGQNVVNSLKANGHNAKYVATAEEALDELKSLIPGNASVGIPGSVTIRQIGALELLNDRGNQVFHHWDPSLTPETKASRLKEENLSDVILTSSNAVTLDGMLVNIDGVGNRVSAMSWGDNKIVFVIGINKIERDLQSAIQRVRDKATPPNAIRLGIDTPCATTGYCMDCDSPKRVCRALLVLERATMGRDSHVIIVGENLGY